MPTIVCSKCGKITEPMKAPPYPGKLGERIIKSVCKECWAEWESVQLMLVNEYQLQLYDKQHRDFLTSKMKEYLNLVD